ncbi:proteasome maturation protein-like [Panulirus ornatus]|uniref:proteasome maturation protein-like n=1 Tax=Panulirus ornatus TaxID=150431 RepID=UPI003A86DD45
MALPQNTNFGPIVTQEKDYGSEMGMLRRAPASSLGHPLEASERSYRRRQDELRLTSASKAFGIGFALHLRHERAAAGCPEIGHLGFLPKSSVHIQALTGRDLELDFTDTLAIEQEVTQNPHLFMEKIQEKSCFGI